MLTKVLQGDWPLTQGYGPATYGGEPPGHGYRRWHEGVDLGCPTGTICLAAKDSTCTRFGHGYIVLEDAMGIEHYYFHISGSLVDIDQAVLEGSPVATSGAEAVAGGVAPTGPHLHYGVRRSPYRYQVDDFDPTPYYQLTFGPITGGGLHLDKDVQAEFNVVKNQINVLEEKLNVLIRIGAGGYQVDAAGNDVDTPVWAKIKKALGIK